MAQKPIDNSNAIIARVQRAIRIGVAKGALRIETRMKQLSPIKTGNLRRSINTQVTDNGTQVSAEIGPNTDYAVHLEYGTSKMRARPFVRPAFDSEGDGARADVENEVKKALI